MAKKKVATVRKEVPDTWQEALQGFLFWKQAQGLAERTLTDYRKHVSQFFNRHPKAYNSKNLKSAVLEYMAQPVKPATFNLRLVNLKAFFDWCIQEGIFTDNPLAGFKRRKAEGRVVNIEEEKLARLLTLPNKETFAGLRDYALLLLTLDTGIRPKEAFSLLVDDINLRSLEVCIRSEIAKTRTTRTLPISPVTAQVIRELLQSRHPAWKNSTPVFCSSEGGKMTDLKWGDRLEVYSKQLGVWIRPYDLRHAFALQFLRNGGQPFALQRILGHTDLTMTKRYIALTQQDLREQHTVASPLNTLAPQKHRVRKIKK
ncbi:integrase [Pelotomaculum thermopropionicum SI]|uniref:Integrase n=1 Tax=Pelotomaculum thermopropionicum (strain DSM 13744 / JCM 10971 / SI) TaxID=370438 RepID=A5D0C7_PELTS|nr:integrase [Pelotomaculum thermopropionicum SI]